jgi:hypothetical protein
MRAIVVLIVICLSIHSKGQNLNEKGMDLSFGMNRIDFFTTLTFTKAMPHNFNYLASFGLGVNRTFFQGRVFPRIGGGLQCILIKKSAFAFIPLITVNYACFKILSNTSYLNQWLESYIGFQWELGKKKIRFIQSNTLGMLYEWFPNQQFPSQQKGYYSAGFFSNIGLKYVF